MELRRNYLPGHLCPRVGCYLGRIVGEGCGGVGQCGFCASGVETEDYVMEYIQTNWM